MQVLIVEDETVAYENLVNIIAEIDSSINIVGNTESIRQTVSWLHTNDSPDLILMDIHLSDGSAFEIFQQIEIETPIVFITAYDEYAIEAFKVNSIDYLLKPIKVDELERAFSKFKKWTHSEVIQYVARVSDIHPPKKYISKILVPHKDQLIPINLKDVSCFYTTNKNTSIHLKNGQTYNYSKTLEQIIATLDPNEFIRANKQFILARDSVLNITVWYDNRLVIKLDVDVPEKIFVSKNKAAEFKAWIVNE